MNSEGERREIAFAGMLKPVPPPPFATVAEQGRRCAVIILPTEQDDADRLAASIGTAKTRGCGDFQEVTDLFPAGRGEARDVLAGAAQMAEQGGCDWLLAVSAGETVSPDIFVKMAPALRLHDAVWGGAGLAGSASAKPEPITRLAAQDLPTFFHAALQWWIGPSHFVRPGAALAALEAAEGDTWYADYLAYLWRRRRTYKTAQRLTEFAESIPRTPEPLRARLVELLQREPVFMTVRYGRHALQLPYTGLNPVIEREQMRGLFFEDEELRYLAGRLPHGLRMLDAGANTGNHTLFFAAVMEAEKVVPIEPHPRAIAAIRAAVAENHLDNVELSCLGTALGAEGGRLRAIDSAAGGLGATRYLPDPEGETPLVSLDALAAQNGLGRIDLLKIDVEGMEMAVLQGSAALITRHRPQIFIEVLDETVAEFMAWVDGSGYAVEKLFPDKTHCNYFLVPKDQA